MLKTKNKNIIYAISVLSGTIIGVAIFSLPYLFLQVGWTVMIMYILILGSLVLALHILFGELVLVTPDNKRLPGIAEYYWGTKGKIFTLITHISCLIGTILSYIIVGGGFLQELLKILGLNFSSTVPVIIFLLAGGLIMFSGSSALNKLQFAGIIGFLAVLFILAWLGKNEISLPNIFARNGDNISWFAPYGVIIFAFWGATLIPQIEDILGQFKHKYMSRVIAISIFIPLIVYLLFVILILGISGNQTEPLALTSLNHILGPNSQMLILTFGIITTFTSFVALGLTLVQVFNFDLKISKIKSWLITLTIPLGLFLLGFKDFLKVIIFLGSVLLAIDGLNVLFMYLKAIKNIKLYKKALIIVLIIMLLFGIVYEINNYI